MVLYSASGNAWPSPQLITISFMPDGTNINGKSSNLQASFNAKFGSSAAWENIILKAAQTWAAQTNINFAVVPDDGAAEGSGSNQQGDPNFGDIRIGGYNFGTTTLGQAFLPPPVNNYSAAGDIQFNTGQSYNNNTTYDLYTVAVHEVGHALGLYHAGVASAVMYSSYNGIKTGLTGDDIAGIQSIYSGGQARAADPYFNSAGSTSNFSSAYDISSQISSSTLIGQVSNGTISTAGGSDLFSLTVPWNAAGNTLRITVQSQGLSLLTPGFVVYNASQAQIASAQGVADGATISSTWSNLVAGSKIYVKVFSPVNTVFGTGAYALTVSLGNSATPAVPQLFTTKLNGYPLSSGGGQAVAVNFESQVNTTTLNSQATSPDRNAVGVDANGNYAITWASQGQDGSGYGVYAQRYAASGQQLGGEFRVNTYTTGDQTDPAIAMDAKGNFVITWQSQKQDGTGWGVYAQRYAADGTAIGGEFQVNTDTSDDQSNPSVAMDTLGFVITWQSHNQDGGGWGVYAQQYNALGLRVGGEFRVNTCTPNDQTNPSVAIDSLGDFTIAYQSSGQDTSGQGIFARRYTPLGVPLGGEFQVNTYITSDQTSPSVAMDTRGDLVIAWQSNGQDGNGWGVYAQRYNSAGATMGGEYRVNTTTQGDELNPSAAMDDSGDVLITWSGTQATVSTIYGQQYTASGLPIGGEFTVNTTMGKPVSSPSVVMNDKGNVISVWTGVSAADPSGGVLSQQFTISFSQETSDGFFAQGDPNDPDRTAAPASPALAVPEAPTPSAPIPVVLRTGTELQFVPLVEVEHDKNEAAPASHAKSPRHELELHRHPARPGPKPNVSQEASRHATPGQHGHAGKDPVARRVGNQHPKGFAKHPGRK